MHTIDRREPLNFMGGMSHVHARNCVRNALGIGASPDPITVQPDQAALRQNINRHKAFWPSKMTPGLGRHFQFHPDKHNP